MGKSLNLQIFGIKMVFLVMRLEEITMRMSAERDEDKGFLSKFLVT